ncbi:LysR family transcriptional regulator [Pseudomonas sp. JUb52]|uniref:LysR family transcriptional regulator n=1 Tax=Pseudomonas sp. JUb52 TaxID=2485127 RepID=UPI0010538015|nr:LysR family transcriptional regulator [Pseudomonas sp. JUb52]
MAAKKCTDDVNPCVTRWDHLKVVLAISRGGTLSAAARALGVEHSTISRQLDSVERELGIRIFERGAKGLILTAPGRSVVESATRMEQETDALLRRLDAAGETVSGTVRLTTTPFLAGKLLAPALPALARQYPHLRIELLGDNRQLDVSKREADVAVRLSRPTAPGLVTRKLADVASAWYAAATDPRSLEDQWFLSYDDASGHTTPQRYIDSVVPSDRILLRANSTFSLMESVRAGLGCALLPSFAAEADGDFRRIQVTPAFQPMALWLAYHEDLRRSPKLRAAIAFIEDVTASVLTK